ncbi:hypothetical protein [Streptomyces sp. DH37]|uniref:hypothetical protein n=1 Tax=Streptomyces sp. DH37 TaxID=3040122 RepID=UPI002442B4EE|nr:hypothetical protein [Streptomyces sp. DH37]MDG9703752.1 hypothetical protein [Streptomyces sp. DH37]
MSTTVSLVGLGVAGAFGTLAVFGGSIQAWLHKRSGHAEPDLDFSDLAEAALPADKEPEEAEPLQQGPKAPEQPPAAARPGGRTVTKHAAPHPLAGQAVVLRPGTRLPHHTGQSAIVFRVEDWADRTLGVSWAIVQGHPAVTAYLDRAATALLPDDGQVLYGRDAFGTRHLVHATEIDEQETGRG